MSYQVIARKYRPQRFEEVVGQEHVINTLANAIQQERIAHAYIFCGPRGTGKTTIARIFAKCLNCENGPTVDFSDEDPRCREITEGRSLDVIEIDGASNNGVEQVRELRETVKFAPASSRFKIYIIDEVHMLTVAAFNALLKTLEEPPAHVKFMFATTDPEKVLPTILSRCQRFDLRRVPVTLIVQLLAHIAQAEGVKIDETALHAIARGADGCIRDAESTLDQLISFCGEEIVESNVLSMFGLTAHAQINALAKAMLIGDQPGILRELNSLASHGKDLGRLLTDLLEHFRNLVAFKVTAGQADWLERTEAENEALAEQADLVETSALTRMMEILTEGETRLRGTTSRHILIEITLLRASEARHSTGLDEVLNQLNALRGGELAPTPAPANPPSTNRTTPKAKRPAAARRPAAGAPHRPPPAAPAAAPPSAAPVLRESPAPTPSAGEGPTVSGEALQQLWDDILTALKKARAFSHRYLAKAFPVSLDQGVLTLGFSQQDAQYLPLVDSAKTRDTLLKLLTERDCPNCRIEFTEARRPDEPDPAKRMAQAGAVSKDDPAPEEPPAEPGPLDHFDPETFKDDPKIKEALEVFRARIAQVIPPGSTKSPTS